MKPNEFLNEDEQVAPVQPTNPTDTVTVDIPLMIRIMEYAKEDAQDDMVLHKVAEQLTSLSQGGKTLTMADYDSIVGGQQGVAPVDETIVKTGSQYELKSHTGKNLGKYPSKAGAEKREKQVNYFKHAKEGVEEGVGDSIKRGVKSVKRGMQGWGGVQDKPADIVKRNKSYNDADLSTMRTVRTRTPPPEGSPAGLQRRVIDREMKKRGLGENGGESYAIIRTNSEGKRDKFAGGFGSYEAAQKELDRCLAHELHTKHKQKFAVVKQGVTESDGGGTGSASIAGGAIPNLFGQGKTVKRKSGVGEGIGQVDELSNHATGEYVKHAVVNAKFNAKVGDKAKEMKRTKGITKAVDRLANPDRKK